MQNPRTRSFARAFEVICHGRQTSRFFAKKQVVPKQLYIFQNPHFYLQSQLKYLSCPEKSGRNFWDMFAFQHHETQ